MISFRLELAGEQLLAAGDWWLPLVILVIVAILFFLFLLKSEAAYPYERIESLCTRTELVFFNVLKEVAGEDFRIFGKTRIADLLRVKSGTRQRMSWQNRINCKHIDFVLCDPQNLQILVAIELDDESHDRADRIQRDEFVNRAFNDAGLPILRIRTAGTYDPKRIRETIDKALGPRNRSFVFFLD